MEFIDKIAFHSQSGLINMFDIVALGIFTICVVAGIKKGLIRMIFDLAGFILSFYLANKIYPQISIFLRTKTNIYLLIKNKIIESLDVSAVVNEYIALGERMVFEKLSIPEFFVDLLDKSNIPPVYEMLNVSGIVEYVGGFLSNMVINGLSCLLAFLAVFVIMRLLASTVDLFSRLPVVKSFNRVGGALAGTVTGLLAVWVSAAIYSVIFIGVSPEGDSLLFNSFIGGYLYSHDMLIIRMANVF